MPARKSGGNNPGKRKLAAAKPAVAPEARTYDHPEAKTLLRPDVGTQASFRKKKPPQTYTHWPALRPYGQRAVMWAARLRYPGTILYTSPSWSTM
jgi:hypothetical protein